MTISKAEYRSSLDLEFLSFGLGLSSFQNCMGYICVVYMPPDQSLVFYYDLNELGQYAFFHSYNQKVLNLYGSKSDLIDCLLNLIFGRKT